MAQFIDRTALKLSKEPSANYTPIATYVKDRPYSSLSDVQATKRLHELKEERNGIKVKTEEVNRDIDKEKLKQTSIKLGIERLNTQRLQETYHQTGHQLITDRYKTAQLKDVAAVTGREWSYKQTSAKQTVEALRLSVNDQIGQNQDDRTVVPLKTSSFSALADQYARNASNN